MKYYYELFTGKWIHQDLLTYAKMNGWVLRETDVPPPELNKGDSHPVYNVKTKQWYKKPEPNMSDYKLIQHRGVPNYNAQVTIHKDPKVFIIDDFFMNPYDVMQQAIDSNKRQSVQQFHALLSDGYINDEINLRLSQLIGHQVKPDMTRLGSNYKFNMASDSDKLNRIHYDGWGDWAMILYLNDEDEHQGKSGTRLYEHIETGWNEYPYEFEKLSKIEGRAKLFEDGMFEDRWRVIFDCKVKFNRAFIYPSRCFHREGEFFDNRIIYRMFLGETNEEV